MSRLIVGLVLFVWTLIGSSLVSSVNAAANINRSINYQGRLLTTGGTNVADGAYAMKFSVYNTASGGTPLWTASGTNAVPTTISVQVTDGLFSVLLGDTSFQGQNPFAFDFNQDGLYLGVSIAGDSEMTPRKRLSSVPYAFNSEALQGQFASSTDISGTSGTGTLFALNQASSTTASATRTTLLIETAGTSDFFDYLLRAKPKNGADVFSISRAGNVTSTGNFVIGDASTDLFTVNARINSDLIPSQDLVYSLGSAALRWNAQLGTVTSTNIFNSGTVSSTNLVVSNNTTLNNVTSTNLYTSGTVSTTQLFVNGTQITGGTPATTATLQVITNNGATTTNLIYAQGGVFSSASSTFTSDLTVLGQTSLQLLSFTNATGSAVTTTQLFVSGTASTSQLYVNGSTVCLTSGVNCPSGSALGAITSSTWQYNSISNIAFLTTSTQDVLVGGGNSTSTALFVVDYRGNTGTATNTILLGGVTTTFVGIGTSTPSVTLDVVGHVNNLIQSGASIPQLSEIDLGGGVLLTTIVDGNTLYALKTSELYVIDITDSRYPRVLGSLSIAGSELRVMGHRAYVHHVDSGTLSIVDVSDPSLMSVMSTYTTSSFRGLEVVGKYAYLNAGTGGIDAIDISSSTNPVYAGGASIGANQLTGSGVLREHNGFIYAFGAAGNGVYDIRSNPAQPIYVTSSSEYPGDDAVIQGNIAYVVHQSNGLTILNYANATSPTMLATLPAETAERIAVHGRYAYTNQSSNFTIYDISSSTNPLITKTLSDTPNSLTVSGNKLVMGFIGSPNIRIFDIPGIETASLLADNAEIGGLNVFGDIRVEKDVFIGQSLFVGEGGLMSHGPGNFMKGLTVNGVNVCLQDGTNCSTSGGTNFWSYDGSGDLLYTTTGTQDIYLGGNSLGTALFSLDFTGNQGTATNTILIGANTTTFVGIGLNTATESLEVAGNIKNLVDYYHPPTIVSTFTLPGSGPVAVHAEGRIVFAVNNTSGDLNTLDYTDPQSPRLLSTMSLAASGTFAITGNASYIYTLNNDSDVLNVIDVTRPAAPVVLSTTTIAVSQAQHMTIYGNTIYIAGTGGSVLTIVDVTEPTEPIVRNFAVQQCGGTEFRTVKASGRYLYTGCGTDAKMDIYDIADPFNPVYLASQQFDSGTDVTYGIDVQGPFAYAAQYTGDHLNIVDISNPAVPYTVATTTFNPGSGPFKVVAAGRYAYTADYTAGTVSVVDISSSTNPYVAAIVTLPAGFTAYDISLSGRYIYVVDNTSAQISVIDIGGVETAGLKASTAELGALSVLTNGYIAGKLNVGTALTVGFGGILSTGPLSVSSAYTTSTFAGAVSSTVGEFSTRLTVGGVNVCLQDGTNCPISGSGASYWSYDGLNDVLYTATATQDVLMGGNTTSTSLFTLDFQGNTGIATNTILLGGSTTTLVGIGTSTPAATLDVVGHINNLIQSGSELPMLSEIDFGSGGTNEIVVDGNTLYALYGGTLGVVDITDSRNPRILGSLFVGGRELRIVGHRAYAMDGDSGTLSVVDVSDPSAMSVLGTFSSTSARGFDLVGNYAYINTGTGIDVVDVSSSTNLTWAGGADVGANQFTNGGAVHEHKGLIYVFGNAGSAIYDVRSNPRQPVYVTSTNQYTGYDFAFQGDNAYVVDVVNGFYILNYADAFAPTLLASRPLDTANQIRVNGRYAYTNNQATTFSIYDISSSTNPIVAKTIDNEYPLSITVSGNKLFMGFLRFFFSPFNIRIYEVPGIETSSLLADSVEVGTLNAFGNIRTEKELTVGQSLFVGEGGILSHGPGNFMKSLTVEGVEVCLEDGTNCPASSGSISSSTWQYNGVSNIAFLTTSTQDVLIGGGNTTSSALFVVDYRGNTGTATNTILLGGVTSTLVGIGTSNPQASLDILGNIRNVHATSQQVTPMYFDDLGLGLTRGVTVVGNVAYVISEDTNRLYLVDVSNETKPLIISSVTIPNGAYAVSVDGRYAATLSNSAEILTLIDISNASAPLIMATTTVSNPIQVVIQGRYVYATNNFDGYLEIFDIVNPTKLNRVSFVDIGTSAAGLYVKGRYAYVTGISNSTVSVVDISNPSAPVLKGSAVVGSQPIGVWATEEYLYVTNRNSDEFNILRITNPSSPVVIATATTEVFPTSVNVQGKYAYITNYLSETLQVFDITSSTNPVSILSTNVGGSLGVSGNFISGKFAYITDYNSGRFGIFDLGGIETIGVQAASVRTGSLNVLSDAFIANSLFISSALNVGIGGMYTAGSLAVGSTNTTSTILFAVSSTVAEFSQRLTVGGVNVCLQSGTNCPSSSGSISTSTWQYNGISNIAFLTTSTQDVLLGGNTTATAGFIWDNGSQGTSTLTIGGSTNTNVLVGTTTYGGGLSTRFGLSGNDLFTQGMIGSIEGMFSATGVTVGTGTTVYADGNIYRTNGGIQFTPSAGSNVSTTANFVPTSDNSLSIGTSAFRWQANLGYVTSVAVTTTNLFATTVSTTNLSVGGFGVCLSSGSNCPAGSSGAMTSSSWQYSYTSNTAFLTTSTMDVLLGGGNTTSSALFVVDYKGNTGTATNTILLGGATTTFVGIGTLTPSSTLDVVGSVTNVMRSGQAMTTLQTASVGSTPLQTIIRGNRLYLINGTTGIPNFRIYDISDSTTSTYLGGISLSTTPVRFALAGNVAYVLTASRLISIDITDATNPFALYSAAVTDGQPRDIDINGNYAYTFGFSGGRVQTFDISNPSNISSVYLSAVSSTEGWNSVSYQAGFLYAVDTFGANYDFQIFSATTTSSTLIGQYSTTTLLHSAVVNGRYAYVSQSSNSRVVVMDVASTTNPVPVGYVTVGSAPRRMKVEGRYLYVSNESGSSVSIVDVASSTAPVLIRTVTVGATPQGMSIYGSYLYVPNSGATTMSVIDMQTGIEASALIAANGSFGTLQVEGDQSILGRLDVQGAISSNGRTVCLSDGSNCPGVTLFTVSSTSGFAYLNTSSTQDLLIGGGQTTSSALFVVDYRGNTGTATNTILLGGVTTTLIGVGTSTPVATLDVIGTIDADLRNLNKVQVEAVVTSTIDTYQADLIVSGDYAYFVPGNGSNPTPRLQVFGISEPEYPKFISSYSLGSQTIFSDNQISGRYLYSLYNSSANNLSIFDVSDPTNIVKVSTTTVGYNITYTGTLVNSFYYTTPGANGTGSIVAYDVTNPYSVREASSSAGVLIHNAGVEELVAQGDYIYGAQGNTGLIVYSIKSPSIPTVYSTTTFGNASAQTYDLAVQGQYLYAAKSSGVLNIIDISNPRFPLVVATSTAVSNVPLKIKVQGKYVYGYSDSHYLTVFDVSSSTNPVVVGQYNTGVNAIGSSSGRELAVRGRYAYLGAATNADSRGRFTILDLGSGVETNALNVSSLFAGEAYVQADLSVQKTLSALGGMRVGTNGILSEGPIQIMATGTTSTFMGAITVSGYTVCLSSGLNCPSASLIVGSLTSSTWQYNGTSNISFLTTTTQDVLMGGNSTATAGFIWDSGSQGTSTLVVGGSTNTNVLVGTTTYGGGLNSRFGLSGNDLFTQGMIGSIEGMFSATGVTVGTGTTVYADGNIYRTNGGIQFTPSTGSNVSTTANFVPVADGTLSIGTAAFRWQGNFTSVTSTGVTSTNLFVSGTASSTNLNAMFVTSTSLFVSGTASTTRLNALNVTTTSLFVSGTVSTTNLLVGGLGVCLSTGTNCPAGTSGAMTSSTWQYNFTANTAFLNTSTMDVLMGGGNTTSSALFIVDHKGNTGTATNTILLGGVTTTFVGIGTSTPRVALDVAGSVSNILRSGQTVSLLRNITGVGSTPNQVVTRGNYLHLINQTTSADNFKVFDISNPASSTVVGKLTISSGTPQRMSVVGNRAYVITETPALLYAIDLSDRARPLVLSSVAITDTGVRDIDVSGEYAYVSSFGTGAIEKFDVSDPTNMTSVTQIASATHGWLDIEVQGRYLYAVDASSPTIQIYDASTTVPVLKSELSIAGAQGLSVQGRFAYVTLSTGGVQVVDIASSTRPIALGSVVVGTNSNRSTVDGRYLYVSEESGSAISIIDISSSTAPNLVRTVTVGSTPRGLSVAGRYLYVPNSGATTISIIDLQGTEVSSLTAANALIGGLQVLQDMMVQGNMDIGGELTVGGRFVCLSDGTGCPSIGGWTESATDNIVSLTTVGRDVLLGGSTSATAGFIWDKGTNGTSTLFVGATTNTNVLLGVNTTSFNNITGLSGYVMDGNDLLVGGKIGALSGLAVRGNIDGALGAGQSFRSTSTNFNLGYSGPVVVHDRYMYQANSGGLVVYDISQYGIPRIVKTATTYFSGGNYNDIAYMNGMVLLSSSDGYIVVVDVSSSTNPIALTQWGNGGSIVRQHALPHPNGRYVYTTNGAAQINVTDLINPASPLEMFTTSTNGGGTQLVTEMVTDGRYLYVVIGTAVPTFEIYDLSIPTRPRKISQITSGLTNAEHLAVQGDYVYLVEAPAVNEINIIDVRNRFNPRIVKTVSPDGGTRADEVLVAGRYMYLGSGGNDVDIYDVSSSTNPIYIQNIVLGSGATNMALAGRYLYVSDLNKIGTVDVGTMETNALQAYTAEITRLMVRDSLDVFQDARIEGGLTVGSNNLDQSYGSISVYASTTSGTVMTVVNNSYNSLDAVLEVRSGCGVGSSDLALFGSNADNRLVSIRCNGQIFADNGTVSTPADYAEYFFASSSDLVAGDAVVLNADVLAYASTSKAHILKGETDLRAKTLGIVSTRPGFVANGADNRENDPAWKVIALMGQVPAKADAIGGVIRSGDELMIGSAGTIVKASGPGMVVGRALEPLNAGTGTIQVYVQPHWWAGDLFATDGSGNSLLMDDLTVASSTIASATSTLIDSPFFTFTAKAWDSASSTEVTHSFKLFADAISSTTSLFSIANASGTSLLDLSNEGDLTVHGKLYLANKSTGMGSTSTYLFIDDTAPSSTMVSTNADGFQAQAAYDYAERYPSQENLEPGDLVTFDAAGPVNSMKRTSSAADAVSGIVSTKPGFLTGAYASGTYPIALAGRVPTKVTASNGSIKVGDALTASNIPGVAMKATQPGIIVGYALENFDLPETGLVQVFVKTGYFGGTVDAAGAVTYAPQSSAVEQIEIEGLALIAAGQTEVKVSFASLKALPAVYVTPGASVDGGWWIASKTDTGFMIILEKPQTHDVEFSWLARPLQIGVKRFKSDNTNETVDPLSGNGIPQVQDSGGESPSSTSSTQTP